MATKRTVGIDFLWSDAGNTGRVNYIVSLVAALRLLPPDQQPRLVIFHQSDSPIERLQALNYPEIRFERLWENGIYRTDAMTRGINRLARTVAGRDILPRTRPITDDMVDCVIPCEHPEQFAQVSRRINWIVDFNERHLPHLFSQADHDSHVAHADRMVATAQEIMVSSESARRDFERFYPDVKKPVHVVRFAVGFSPSTSVTKDDLAKKYGLSDVFAITPNQFWPHKNHHLLVRAFAASKFPGQLILTGAAKGHRDPDYLPSLERLIDELNAGDRIRYVGQVPRDEQLALIKFADVVVQPSLFEGWSTLVEECKAFGKFLIVSDLDVHREQIDENCWFFDPQDQAELTALLDRFTDERPKPIPVDYDEHRRGFARTLLSMIEYVPAGGRVSQSRPA